MVKGACHPNGSNFQRVARLDVVNRVRRLSEVGLLKERPKWLVWCERVPPMENHNLQLQTRTVRSPYPQMVNFLLKKYPDLRFQDCYVDGNDWSAGNDAYRDDHPVMQFVGKQLEIMRMEGTSKKEAFKRTEEHFRERRRNLETEQKLMMAMAVKAGFQPMFCTGRAYLEVEKARLESMHLKKIIGVLRKESAALRSAGEVPQLRHRAVEEKVFRAFVKEPPTPKDDDEALQRLAQPLSGTQEEKKDETTSKEIKETPQEAMPEKLEAIDQAEEKALQDTMLPDEAKETSYTLRGKAQTGQEERVFKMLDSKKKQRHSYDDDPEASDEDDGDNEEKKRKREAGDDPDFN